MEWPGWTSIPSRGSRNTPSRFMLHVQKWGISSGSYGPVGSKASFFFFINVFSNKICNNLSSIPALHRAPSGDSACQCGSDGNFNTVFWKWWSTEYLNALQLFSKWRQPKQSSFVNDIVHIKNNLAKSSEYVPSKGAMHFFTTFSKL